LTKSTPELRSVEKPGMRNPLLKRRPYVAN
jgi:hypothetical protein